MQRHPRTFTVSVTHLFDYLRNTSWKTFNLLQVTQFLNNQAKGTNIIGATSLPDMISKLKTPRKIMLLVKSK